MRRGSGRTVRLGCLLLACAALLYARSTLALDPALDISQYAHTAWKIRDGFPKGIVHSMAQTPDGYLWLGTDLGLFRFDGVRALPWLPLASQQLPNDYIRCLLAARDGTLWIGTAKGLASWKDGKLTQYPEAGAQSVNRLLQDQEGTVWFTLGSPGRVCAIRSGKGLCDGADSFGVYAFGLYEDRSGSIWVSSQTGVWRWKPGNRSHYGLPSEAEATALIEDDRGAILLATRNGIKELADGKFKDYPLPGFTQRFRPTHFLRSSDGTLWIATLQGLLHLHQGRTDSFQVTDGLSGDSVVQMFEDREGSIWVSTLGGLDRFRDYSFPRVSREQGLSSSSTWSVQATPDASVWIGTAEGLNRWRNGHMTVYGQQSFSVRDEKRIGSRAVVRGLQSSPRSLGLDDLGRLWVSTADRISYFEQGQFVPVPRVPGGNVFAGIAGDGRGGVWISYGELGLFHLDNGGTAVEKILLSRFRNKLQGPTTLLPELSSGGVWLGFEQGDVIYVKDGQVRNSYTETDGLGKGAVSGLRFGPRGGLWAATEGGLSRIKDGHVATLTSKNGLPCDQVKWTMEDADHFVWLYMPCGLVRIARSELDAWVNDPKHTVQTTVFDASDGVRTTGFTGGFGPRVTKTPDGRIWFVPLDGVSVIDPRRLPFNRVPPPVYIEQITADRRVYDASNGLRLPPLVRDLEIDYTALSLMIPEKNRFRVRLEGYDRDWQDAGNRRQAFYTNLPPRHYRFRVTACNNSGVWNEEGAALDFAIAPAYYQTNWFRALCVAAFLAMLWALYQLRLRQVARQFNMRLEERVNERTRIARELHDTMLQSFQAVLLFFQAASDQFGTRPAEAKLTLDRAIDKAAQAVSEGRAAIQGLRLSTTETNSLAASLNTLGEELAAREGNSPVVEVQVEGSPRDLHPILRDDIFRIAGEALRNAFLHAQASRIEVNIRYGAERFRVRIRDDGRGIDSQIVTDKGRAGHWGLRGMHERAKLIGGNLEVWSKGDAGTEVELSIPPGRAYATPTVRLRSWFAKKGSRPTVVDE